MRAAPAAEHGQGVLDVTRSPTAVPSRLQRATATDEWVQEEARKLVKRTRREQGLPVTIEDKATLRRIAAIFDSQKRADRPGQKRLIP